MTYSPHLLRHFHLIIGQNIHNVRRDKMMPLGILAELAGVSHENLDYYEIGRSEIPFDHMLRIACALDTDIAALLK